MNVHPHRASCRWHVRLFVQHSLHHSAHTHYHFHRAATIVVEARDYSIETRSCVRSVSSSHSAHYFVVSLQLAVALLQVVLHMRNREKIHGVGLHR